MVGGSEEEAGEDVGQFFQTAGGGDFPVALLCKGLQSLAGMGRKLPGESSKPHVDGFHHRDHLPHLKREGASYFVTFRLAGTLPAELLARLKRERDAIVAEAEAAKRP